jgi:hypothetical protein
MQSPWPWFSVRVEPLLSNRLVVVEIVVAPAPTLWKQTLHPFRKLLDEPACGSVKVCPDALFITSRSFWSPFATV